MNRQQRRHPRTAPNGPTLPPVVAFLDAAELMGSGSPLYRVHRPAQVLGHKLDWITLVTSKASVPTKKDPWYVEVEGQPLLPQVLVLRPTMLAMVGESVELVDLAERWEQMRRYVEAAQLHGQILILDLDDHPYAWDELHDEKITPEQWEAHDAYVRSFNTVLCSTRYLIERVLQPRFGSSQSFNYAPNLYDPFRYSTVGAQFGKRLGSHLYVKARDSADFERLGASLIPVLDADPELRFVHIGEEFSCVCGHRVDEHWEQKDECDHCGCSFYEDGGHDSLALASGIPRPRIEVLPTVSPYDLPDAIHNYNVGVVPLADSEWNHAKTEGKGFEMAAAGVPFVAVTGEHPLYAKLDSHIDSLHLWTTEPALWQYGSVTGRRWAERLAQEHEIDYLATMTRLASSNLSK